MRVSRVILRIVEVLKYPLYVGTAYLAFGGFGLTTEAVSR